MFNRRSIPAKYNYHRPLLADVLPFEVPPTFGNAGFFDFVTRYNVRLERRGCKTHVVWECDSCQVDEAIWILFNTREHPSAPKGPEDKCFQNPASKTPTKNGKKLIERRRVISKQAMRTIPYGFDIAHKEREFRRLSVIHPRNQIAVADFYNKNISQILYYTGLSDVSIRYPASVAKKFKFSDRLFSERKSKVSETVEQSSKEYENLGSFFSYKHYSNIFKFYEHYKYHNAEKKFDVLLRLDVSKCFDSIYTHSLPWSTLGTSAAKDHLTQSKQTFGGRFDGLLQNMNQGETNGIVIGPEFSRIFAEIILQKIDRIFLHAMKSKHKYEHKSDFQAFRYVDDYFIFCSSDVKLWTLERELGVALKEMKLSINAAKSEVVKKPIITDLTIAKNRVRQVFNDCIEIFESEVEDPCDSEKLIWRCTPKVRSNSMIVGFKTILKETKVGYKDILNYSFAALERNITNIFGKYKRTRSDIRDERALVQAIMGILEFAFFTYAADPRVNISVRLSRLIAIVVDQMNLMAVGRDSKHQVLKYIFDNVTRQLKKSSSNHSPNVEAMYLISALKKLGSEYTTSEEVLAEYFGFKRKSESEPYCTELKIDYFATTVCLCYIAGKKKKYSRLICALEKNILQRIASRSAYVQNDAELVMIYLDVVCCPIVSKETKTEIACVFGHSECQMRSLQGSSRFWFTDWEKFDLTIALDKKRTREVY